MIAVDGTDVLVALIGAIAVVLAAALAILGKWLEKKVVENVAASSLQNTEEHGETSRTLQRLVDGQGRIEHKIDNHLEFHAHSPNETPPHLVVVHSQEY